MAGTWSNTGYESDFRLKYAHSENHCPGMDQSVCSYLCKDGFCYPCFLGYRLTGSERRSRKTGSMDDLWGCLIRSGRGTSIFCQCPSVHLTGQYYHHCSHDPARGYADRSPDIKRARHIQKSCRSFDRSIGCLTDHFSIVGYKYRFIRQLDR